MRATWNKIGFRVVEASAGAGLTGLTAIAPNATWAAVFTGIAIAAAVKAIGGTGADVHSIVRAGKNKRASPLFAFDGLVAIGKRGAEKERVAAIDAWTRHLAIEPAISRRRVMPRAA